MQIQLVLYLETNKVRQLKLEFDNKIYILKLICHAGKVYPNWTNYAQSERRLNTGLTLFPTGGWIPVLKTVQRLLYMQLPTT